ncbi:DNA-processing protein DprA [Halomonas huangheensis]|uniref:Uncharacterized protein n=1 Tax=Halomonas huangheensis TaxID=1178482 RepID=W1NB52_9GAMM|nr:DNA-processing protein DprA [Halomonas huangheensis]ALM53681.1 hypothetical protein AR456_16425 [Halomonas huangheensis]ERL52411.1 hypothetical protein BJB45_10620 [Halomonas huangheensis]
MTLIPVPVKDEYQSAIRWLVLSALPKVGPVRLAGLRNLAPQWPQGWLANLPAPSATALRLWLDHPQRSPFHDYVQRMLEWQQAKPHRYLLHPDHALWPRLLSEIADPPAILWAEGSLEALHAPCVAMVGSRRPTRAGLHHASHFAAGLCDAGWTLVSGMALGIDGAAQTAAMDAGGVSIAVLPGGVDVVYPSRHAGLYQRLRDEGGLLLAQRPLAMQPRAGDFPSRNRIVTGLSCGVVVIEAAERSGTLISARLALEQGREVMALPGALGVPQARGCLQLIRDGAALVRDVDDVLAELSHWLPALRCPQSPPSSDAETDGAVAGEPAGELSKELTKELTEEVAGKKAREGTKEGAREDVTEVVTEVVTEEDASPLLRWLSATPTPLDALVDLSGWQVAPCQRELMHLEIEGRAMLVAGGWVRVPQ